MTHVTRYCVVYVIDPNSESIYLFCPTIPLSSTTLVLLLLSPKLYWSYYSSLLNYIGPTTPLS